MKGSSNVWLINVSTDIFIPDRNIYGFDLPLLAPFRLLFLVALKYIAYMEHIKTPIRTTRAWKTRDSPRTPLIKNGRKGIFRISSGASASVNTTLNMNEKLVKGRYSSDNSLFVGSTIDVFGSSL